MPGHSLEKVWINGFRGLRNLSLDGLGTVNVLVGANNSGKTSVLEALSILCNPYEPYEWLAMVRRRDFGGLDETHIQSLRWCFPQAGELGDPEFLFQSHCEMTCAGAFPLRKLRVEYKDIVGEPSPKEVERMARNRGETGSSTELGGQWRGAEITHFVESDATPRQEKLFDAGTHSTIEPIFIQVWEKDRMMGRRYRSGHRGNLPTDTLTPYFYQLNRLQVQGYSQHLLRSKAGPTRGREDILELITQFDPDIDDITIASLRGARPAIYLSHKRLGPAPLSIFGDALRRAVLLASTLYALKGGGVLLIDEVEMGIHVSALGRVFAWLGRAARQFGVQVVATTHSLEVIDALVGADPKNVDDIVAFHLEQTEKGTKVKRTSGELLYRLRYERGLDVR